MPHRKTVALGPAGRRRLAASPLAETSAIALTLLEFLAKRRAGRPTGLDEIRRACRSPRAPLKLVLDALREGGFIRRDEGRPRGYSLARPARRIHVSQVVRSVEVRLHGNECLLLRRVCEVAAWCPVQVVWRNAYMAFVGALSRLTIADLPRDPPWIGRTPGR